MDPLYLEFVKERCVPVPYLDSKHNGLQELRHGVSALVFRGEVEQGAADVAQHRGGRADLEGADELHVPRVVQEELRARCLSQSSQGEPIQSVGPREPSQPRLRGRKLLYMISFSS